MTTTTPAVPAPSTTPGTTVPNTVPSSTLAPAGTPGEPPRWWAVSRDTLADELAALGALAEQIRTANGPSLGALAAQVRVKAPAVRTLAARISADLAGGVTPW